MKPEHWGILWVGWVDLQQGSGWLTSRQAQSNLGAGGMQKSRQVWDGWKHITASRHECEWQNGACGWQVRRRQGPGLPSRAPLLAHHHTSPNYFSAIKATITERPLNTFCPLILPHHVCCVHTLFSASWKCGCRKTLTYSLGLSSGILLLGILHARCSPRAWGFLISRLLLSATVAFLLLSWFKAVPFPTPVVNSTQVGTETFPVCVPSPKRWKAILQRLLPGNWARNDQS